MQRTRLWLQERQPRGRHVSGAMLASTFAWDGMCSFALRCLSLSGIGLELTDHDHVVDEEPNENWTATRKAQ